MICHWLSPVILVQIYYLHKVYIFALFPNARSGY